MDSKVCFNANTDGKYVLNYFKNEPDAAHLLDFTLESGFWSLGSGYRKKAHGDLLFCLPLVNNSRREDRILVDNIMLPEMKEDILNCLLSLIYSGR